MNNHKRKSVATKIALLVIAAVVLSNLVCITICIYSARNQISRAVQNNMLGMAETYSTTVYGIQEQQGGEPLSYERYAEVLSSV